MCVWYCTCQSNTTLQYLYNVLLKYAYMYLTGPVTVNKNKVKCFNYIFEEFNNFMLVHGIKTLLP